MAASSQLSWENFCYELGLTSRVTHKKLQLPERHRIVQTQGISVELPQVYQGIL